MRTNRNNMIGRSNKRLSPTNSLQIGTQSETAGGERSPAIGDTVGPSEGGGRAAEGVGLELKIVSSMFGGGFKASKCKTLLRLAMARIKLLRNKRDIQVKQMRKDIGQLLQTGQEPSARIRVEHIIREQNIMAAYDILELFCELLTVRLSIIEAQKLCPLDLKEAVSSLIFAAPRCADLPELIQIRTLFSAKYGKEFVAAAAELRPECGVNRRIIEKLSVKAPKGEAKLKLLKEIAEEFKVEWDPTDTEAELLGRHEDLLDGPVKFISPSSEESVSSANVIESSSFSRRAQDTTAASLPFQPPPPPPPPPSAPSPSAPIQMMPLDPSSDEDSFSRSRSSDKPQFVPFLGPHPSQRAEPAPIPSRSNTTSSRSEAYSQGNEKEGRKDMEKSGDYVNVDEAVQAAAEYTRKAAAAAQAVATLRKSQSMSPSPPRSRRGPVRSSAPVEYSDEEDSDEEEPQRRHERRRPSARYTEETQPKRSDSDRSRDGASLTRRNVEEQQEFSFRTNIQPEPRSSYTARRSSNSGDHREDPSLRRASSNEGSNRRTKSEEPKETPTTTARRKSDDLDEVSFRRNSSGGRGGGIFSSNTDEDQQESSTFWKRGSESRFDVEPPRKVDPDQETFWKPADEGWRSRVETDVSKKIDAGIFTGEEDADYTRKSSRRNDPGSYSNASNIFSRADSAESSLFKRSDSAELDGRSSDEFYATKQGFATPKFDDEDHSSSYSVRSSRLSTKYEEDPFERNSSSSSSRPSTLNHFWRSASRSQDTTITKEDEEFVKKFSFASLEDLKPLDKSKSDSLFEKDSYTENIERAGSDPLHYNRSYTTQESPLQKQESSTPVKSRRTKTSKEDGGGSAAPRRSKTYSSYDDNPTTFDDTPYNSRAIPFKPSPSSNSSVYESPETHRESPPPITADTSSIETTCLKDSRWVYTILRYL
ncbi:hypothetical protein R1flu_006644 [Riccia fluitans]|uniref:IST1-like protein n=1 Tax=Riccia fluitans TaxID=41844 RepID=A0ABD1YWK6_9MARC